jgi:thioester reductase-like protein
MITVLIRSYVEHIGSREYMRENFVEPQLACGSGYSESKWVAERLIELAASQTSLCPVVVRVGQISGAKNGFWNATEWLPSIVQSIKNVGCLPDSLQVSTMDANSLKNYLKEIFPDNLVDSTCGCSEFTG